MILIFLNNNYIYVHIITTFLPLIYDLMLNDLVYIKILVNYDFILFSIVEIYY